MDTAVVYYARVSTEKVDQNRIVNQRCHFEDLIKSNPKWTFCGGYIDDGICGVAGKEKLEEFQRMISDARAGKFDLIITKEISRFARNT